MNIESHLYIFVVSYPNTPEKISTLIKCVESLKKSNFPVVSISNFPIPEDVLSIFDDYYVGINEECCFDDIFTTVQTDEARNNSRFLLHFDLGSNETISYKSFGYGKGCTYHWSALNQMNYIINYCKDKNISHAMIFEGDSIVDIQDIEKIKEYFNLMICEELKFLLSTSPMFEFMSGNVWFCEIKYVTDFFSNTSCQDFLKSTYPNFSAESYLYNKLLSGGGRGKIFLHECDSLERIYGNCLIEKIFTNNDNLNCNPLNLFFPNTTEVNLSQSTKRIDQRAFEPLTYIDLGIGKLKEQDVLFIWNKFNKTSIDRIFLEISIKDKDKEIFYNLYESFPDVWFYTPIYDLTVSSYCLVKIRVIDITKKEFITSYRFEHIKN